jgi:hypothetical protein
VEDYLDHFQLTALTVFLTVFVGRSLHMGLVKKINPFALGVGKGGLQRVVEVGFLFGFVAWAFEIVASALKAGWRVFPGLLRWQVNAVLRARRMNDTWPINRGKCELGPQSLK